MVLPGVSSLSGLNAVPSMFLDLCMPCSLVSELWLTYVSILQDVREAHSQVPVGLRGQQQLQALGQASLILSELGAGLFFPNPLYLILFQTL